MAASARSSLRRILVLLAVAAGLFLLLELSARVYLFGSKGLSPTAINSVRGLPETGYTQPSAEPRLGFELKPNLDGVFKLVPFRTNAQGLRDREYALTKPERTLRVAVVGSSFALPAGVEIERAFHSLLEQRFSQELAPTRVEFINFAVGMYNPEQVLAMLELRALASQPDLVLMTATRLSMPWLVTIRARRPDAPCAVWTPRCDFGPSFPSCRLLGRLPRTHGARPDPVGWPSASRSRSSLPLPRRSGASRRARQPFRGQRDRAPGAPRPRRQIGRARSAGVRATRAAPDQRESQRRRAPDPLPRHARCVPRDSRQRLLDLRARPHPNGKAHEVFARVIATFLRSNGLMPMPPRP
jgi:hypothetical protein